MLTSGSCHCGNIRFQVEVESNVEVEDCNCSICSKAGFLHLIVPLSKFTLLSADTLKQQSKMSTYTFNTGVAQHYFCQQCGVKPFYIPRSNPDGIDINFRCLDDNLPNANVVKFDGNNWEENAHTLKSKSVEK